MSATSRRPLFADRYIGVRSYARSPDFLAFRIEASAVFFVPLYPLGRIVGAMTPPDAEAEQPTAQRHHAIGRVRSAACGDATMQRIDVGEGDGSDLEASQRRRDIQVNQRVPGSSPGAPTN